MTALTDDLWVPWATRLPGISDKVYSEPNRGLGLIGHSIVGSWQAALSRFLSRDRTADGRYTPNAAASVMFGLLKSGELIEMYSTKASTWTSGGREANTAFWAIEAEGGPPSNPGEPLTSKQVDTLLRLCVTFTAATGKAVIRGATFVEHGAIAKRYGYDATACPSNRYRDFYAALEEDDLGAQADQILARLAALEATVKRIDKGIALGPDGKGYDTLNVDLNTVLTAHIENHPALALKGQRVSAKLEFE